MTSRHLGAMTRWGLSILLGVAAITTTAAASFELPPLVQPASSEHHSGKVIWADLITSDLAGAKRFYGGLFGWTFHDIYIGDKDYAVALLNGAPVGGIVQRTSKPGEHRQPSWLTFISVQDVSEAERITLAHGGKVLSKPRTYAQRGRQAVFTDPQGAVFAVLQSSSGDPQDVLAVPGEWIWSSLLTSDPGAGAAFYQAIFGYEVFDLPSDDDLKHVLLSTDNYARASLNELPPAASKLHSHWLNFLRVISTTDAVTKVKALGGRVLVAPHLDRHGDLVAVVADPAGAPFGLLEWTNIDTKEVTK
jgi:predicted enzyme related to lactoylglutathione lyase